MVESRVDSQSDGNLSIADFASDHDSLVGIEEEGHYPPHYVTLYL